MPREADVELVSLQSGRLALEAAISEKSWSGQGRRVRSIFECLAAAKMHSTQSLQDPEGQAERNRKHVRHPDPVGESNRCFALTECLASTSGIVQHSAYPAPQPLEAPGIRGISGTSCFWGTSTPPPWCPWRSAAHRARNRLPRRSCAAVAARSRRSEAQPRQPRVFAGGRPEDRGAPCRRRATWGIRGGARAPRWRGQDA